MSSHRLVFDENAGPTNNQFHGRFNTTVRYGLKYLDDVRPGDNLVLNNISGDGLGCGVVSEVWAGMLMAIPKKLMEAEHDPQCRTMDGLKKVLKNAYRNPGIDDTTLVTVIGFEFFGYQDPNDG